VVSLQVAVQQVRGGGGVAHRRVITGSTDLAHGSDEVMLVQGVDELPGSKLAWDPASL